VALPGVGASVAFAHVHLVCCLHAEILDDVLGLVDLFAELCHVAVLVARVTDVAKLSHVVVQLNLVPDLVKLFTVR
jgi:hypothetical protein